MHARHRHQEFLRFIKTVERSVDPDLEIHVSPRQLRHAQARNVPELVGQKSQGPLPLRPPPGPPGPISWNASFGELDERQLKRLAVNSVSQLIHAINTYLDHRNEDPTPFVWTKSVQEILTKTDRGLKTLEALH